MKTARRLASFALFSTALATSALAADIQSPVSNWTGWHIGAGVGYGMVNHEIGIELPTVPPAGADIDFSGIGGEGGLATVEAGYDFEVGSGFLIGAQADYTYSGISTDLSVNFGGSASYELEATHQISAIVRGGRIVNDNTLMYSLVGWTRTQWNGNVDIPIPGLGDYDYTTDGLTLGGGIESVVADNTTLKLEYRYTMNETKDIFTIPGTVSIDENANVHSVRAVLSYRPGVFAKSFDGSEERWNGLRAGFGGGYSMINHELSADLGPFGADFSGVGGEGFFGTLEVGYDMLLNDRFVAGLQADYTYSFADTTLDATGLGGSLDYSLQATHSASALFRAGVLSSPDVLWYGIAGYTHTWFDGDLDINPGVFSASYDYDKGGLTVGGGVEVMLNDSWSWKSEYRYTSLGEKNIISGGGFSLDANTNIQQVRSVLTYRF